MVSLGLCHSFKSRVLPLFLLLQGHPSRRVCLSLHRLFRGYVLGTDVDPLLKNSNFCGSYCLHQSLVSVQTTGREHSPTHQQKTGLKVLLSMVPPIRTRPSFSQSHSFPSGSFHKPLILISQRADRMKTIILGN